MVNANVWNRPDLHNIQPMAHFLHLAWIKLQVLDPHAAHFHLQSLSKVIHCLLGRGEQLEIRLEHHLKGTGVQTS